MSQFPKITVVTPCYNMIGFLEETILSVINQNYPNLEYIIIDGGSDDGSVEIIKKYQDKLAYWNSESDEGMYHAIQKGFEKSTGEIMCWLNADDIFLPNALFAVAELFEKYSHCEWIEGNNVICNEEGTLINSKIPLHHTRYNFLLNRHLNKNQNKLNSFGTVQQESTFWRRSLWEKSGSKMDTTLKYGGDFELWMRFFNYAELYVTTTLFSAFRIRINQNSDKFRSTYLDEIKWVIKNENIKIDKKVKKSIHFIKIVSSLPFLLRIDSIKNKYTHYTQNSIITL